jgi:hypothetical protein
MVRVGKWKNITFVNKLIFANHVQYVTNDVKHHTFSFFKHFYHGTGKLTLSLTQKVREKIIVTHH